MKKESFFLTYLTSSKNGRTESTIEKNFNCHIHCKEHLNTFHKLG